jgi:hypothetical protein
MTHIEFNTLEADDQAFITWYEGVYLEQYFDGTFNILLFQVDGFYVEVFYHPTQDEVYGYRSFHSPESLDPYLDKIDIGALLQLV